MRVCLKKFTVFYQQMNWISWAYIFLNMSVFSQQHGFFFFFNLSLWSLNVAFTDPQCVLGNVFSYTSAFNFTVLSARRNFSFVLALLLLSLWRFSSFHQVFCLSAWNQDKRRTDQQTSSFQILVNNTCTFVFFFCPPSLSTFSTSPSQDTTSVWFAVWSCILMRMG